MTPPEKAKKEMEVIAWMNKKGYDRRASKDVAPIIVSYLDEVEKNISSKQDIIKSVCEHKNAKWEQIYYCSECKESLKMYK